MPDKRIIPVLLTDQRRLVKTTSFRKPVYVGDAVNAVRIFNEKHVPEIAILDIAATRSGTGPDIPHIAAIAGECFMPLIYGGGIRTADDAARVFDCGVEKIVLNTAASKRPALVTELAKVYGSQSIVVSIDTGGDRWHKQSVFIGNGKTDTGADPVAYARMMQDAGAGELLLTSIDRDGTYSGYDTATIAAVSAAVRVPVIACGGAGNEDDLLSVFAHGASAAAAGSMFFFMGPHKAVLLHFPTSII